MEVGVQDEEHDIAWKHSLPELTLLDVNLSLWEVHMRLCLLTNLP